MLQTAGRGAGGRALEGKIQQRVREYMDRANHEYYLREQIHAIQDELGDNEDEEIAELRAKLAKSKMNDEARERVSKELKRLARTAVQAPESAVSQIYIEYMLELPWDVKDREHRYPPCTGVLEAEHYGMKEVKERLIEFLAVRAATKGAKSPILCLVGRPAWARPPSRGRWPGRWDGSSRRFRWAAYTTKRRFAAIARPTWARCREKSSPRSASAEP